MRVDGAFMKGICALLKEMPHPFPRVPLPLLPCKDIVRNQLSATWKRDLT